MTETIEIPRWFWRIAGLSLIWNLLGVGAFMAQMMTTPEMMAELPQAEQDLYNNTPMWATVAFAIAVFGGALGSAALFIRKAFALVLFIISLMAVAVQMFHSFFISNSFEVFGPGGLIMPVMVVTIAIALIGLANMAKTKQWIS